MEDPITTTTTTTTTLTISELIHGSCPLTGASSLNPSPPIPSQHSRPKKPALLDFQTPIAKTLKPLHAVLVGILALPSFDDSKPSIKCSCFQFSDGSAAVCCDISDFDPNMIGRKVRILAWNFIPCGGRGGKVGFLEITRWALFPSCSENVNICCLSDFSTFCLSLGSCDSSKASKGAVFGVVKSISPVCVVPCASGEKGLKSVCGFLVNVFVCVCELCRSKFLVSQLSGLGEESAKDHSFAKRVVLYFCGKTSSWHPVITRLIGCVVLVRGVKKKDVFLGKDECQLMYVTNEAVALHVLKSFPKWNLIWESDIKRKSDSCSYTGVITGVYMQGMVVELDRDVMLLLTDQYLTVPHCMRVGAIVTLRNVHFMDPKFSWGKVSILGACYRTSMYMESFSPLETGYYSKSHSESLLQKFMDSLSFSARLWVLLVISCFRKKFAGILSEKEILGSKHKEGLVQKFASKHLRQSAFQSRRGVLVEFCKHDLCPGGDGLDYGELRLVLPISNLISYCEVSWKKILDDWENCDDFSCGASQKKPLSCNGRSHTQSIRRVLRIEEKGVLALGVLKISLSSGRLQLVDATGVIDIVLDLPATWDFKRIFEVKDFIVIIEGAPQKLVDLNSLVHPLSCKSIFSNDPLVRKTKISLYLYHDPRAEDSRRRSLFFDFKEYEIGSGIFHLLMLTHKYPIQQRFQGVHYMFAEAIILPWNLLVSGKHEDAVMTGLSLDHLRDSVEKFTEFERHHKRCKIDKASTETSVPSSYIKCHRESISCASPELPCLIGSKGVNCHWGGILCSTSEHVNIGFDCKTPRKRLLLEFDPTSFCMYQALKIGRCYLFKHEDKFCSSNDKHAKIFIDSGTQFWSFRFSSIEGLPSTDASDVSQFHNHIGHEIDSDINLSVPTDVLNSLEKVIKVMGSSSTEPTLPFEEKEDIVDAPLQFARSSCSDFPLPVGNLISLHGLVVALHDCPHDSFPVKQRLIPGEGCQPKFLQGNSGVCVHVLVDNCMVQIFSDLSKQAYPIEFGRDVHATFHRILVLSGRNKYMMIPVSFITISHGSLMKEQQSDKDKAETVCLPKVASPNTVPRLMISDLLQLSEFKPVQFHCRVVAVYILVVEKSRTNAVFQLSHHSIPSVVSIPVAGFIVDDGSSSCCCWADSGIAAALLGLGSEASPVTSEICKTRSGLPYSSNVACLNQVLAKHGRIVVKNYGSMFDSLSQDLSFVVSSGKSISSSDEDLLRSLISNASFSTLQTVLCGLMDPDATKQLEERLMESHMAIPPLLNVWATSVCHTDMLAEARNIFEDLKICS